MREGFIGLVNIPLKNGSFFLKIYGKVPLIYRKPVNFQIELIKNFLKYLNSANDINTF